MQTIFWLCNKNLDAFMWMIRAAAGSSLALIVLAATMLPPIDAPAAENYTIRAPAKARLFTVGPEIPDIDFGCKATASGRCRLSEYLDFAHVCALVVVKSGVMRLEFYNTDPNVCHDADDRPNGPRRLYGLASVAKSITSTLVGQAIATRYKARTRDEFEAVLKRLLRTYVGGLDGGRENAYGAVSLDSILRMRSGIRWSEYGWHGFFSDADRFGVNVRDNWARSIPEFSRRYRVRSDEEQPFNYSALDTAIAGYVAESMLGRERLLRFMERELWAQIGAESEARWGIDKDGTPVGPCCLKTTVGDLVRFGDLVLSKGRTPQGQQVIPQAWFELATQRSSKTDTIPDDSVSQNNECPLEYRYFWWLRKGHQDFTAIGRDGQFLHVYPKEKVVIAQISDWKAWTNGDFLECETFNAHDAIAAAASRK